MFADPHHSFDGSGRGRSRILGYLEPPPPSIISKLSSSRDFQANYTEEERQSQQQLPKLLAKLVPYDSDDNGTDEEVKSGQPYKQHSMINSREDQKGEFPALLSKIDAYKDGHHQEISQTTKPKCKSIIPVPKTVPKILESEQKQSSEKTLQEDHHQFPNLYIRPRYDKYDHHSQQKSSSQHRSQLVTVLPSQSAQSTSILNDEKQPSNKSSKTAVSSTVKKKHPSRTKKDDCCLLPIVCEPVELPLVLKDQRIPLVFLPCVQFPDSYQSPTCLTVQYWKKYSLHSVSFLQNEIGYFSTADRSNRSRCREDYRYLKHLLYDLEQRKVKFDLNIGAPYLEPKEPPTSLESLLWWLINHKKDIFRNEKFIFDFLSWRGTLRKIMCQSLFDNSCDWRIGIIKFKGCHFIHIYHTETELNIEHSQTAIDKRMCYWEKPEFIPSPKKLFSSVNLANLGIHTMLYGCEIDAVTRDSKLDIGEKKYVEIKVVYANSLIDLHTDWQVIEIIGMKNDNCKFCLNFSSRKYGKWWAQCYLTGIQQMLIGFRDAFGIVNSIQPLSLKDIEQRAKTWSASSFLSFLNEFCMFVKKTVINDYLDEKLCYLFYYSPKEKVIKWRSTNEEKYQFLPQWFIEQF
ncbi:unnamed protein product [Didymodactylos carnosus]|uniref:Decapping nuclease n=1 Tax=Didymodactylos carnosus TaxID=1234261 RepID=A0A814CZK2_9BILA|nr:unnamed protein product [Didymodactylos carnosus]CAF0950185.1 unnamed protein product [Didymodactylos carnosus]CAF3695881.1 unnamed protein product [Didymodactylos carnosus]CAF3725879.1 unnamed protein product [Didymodactylos carnosus]